jgi:hypothetical protein
MNTNQIDGFEEVDSFELDEDSTISKWSMWMEVRLIANLNLGEVAKYECEQGSQAEGLQSIMVSKEKEGK